MSDRTQPHGAGELNAPAPVSLAEALRALPPLAPPADGWAEMDARLATEDGFGPSFGRLHAQERTRTFAQRMARRASARMTRVKPESSVLHSFSQRFAKAKSPDSGLTSHPAVENRRNDEQKKTFLPLAVAATLLVAVTATLSLRQNTATGPGSSASSVHNVANSTTSHDASPSPAADLAAVQSRSRSLERWLRDTGAASAPQSTQDLAASAEIEDMIGLVDVQLGAADPTDAKATLPLWHRRVALLEDLSTLRYSANALSLRNGIAVNDAFANRMSATPAVWKN